MTHQLMAHFSLKGKKGKEGFETRRLYGVVLSKYVYVSDFR